MAKYLLLGVLATAFILPMRGEAHTDMKLLRDTACEFETRGESRPDKARGKSDERGFCQMRPSTARQMGFKGDLALLERRSEAKRLALKYFYYCARRLRTDNPARLLHCYNGGPGLPWKGLGRARKYAADVLTLYRQAKAAHVIARLKLYREVWL